MTEREQHYFEVLMEEMNGKFSLVLEGHDAIRKEFNEQLDEVCRKQNLFESLLKFSHDEMNKKIDSAAEELKQEMAVGFKDLGAKVNRASEKESALGQKVEGHEDRIRFLERKVA